MKLLRKLFKFITSRQLICALIIIGGLVLLAIIINHYINVLFPVLVANYVLSVITILCIINRDTIWETKAPWIIVLLVFPPLGILMYWTIGHRYKTIREAKFLKKAAKEAVQSDFYNDTDLNELKEKDVDAYGKALQIVSETHSLIYRDTFIKYYSSGEEAYDTIINALKSAKKYIFMEFFIVSNGRALEEVEHILFDKVKEGVEVRFMYDDVGSFVNLKNNYYKMLRKHGVDASCFAKFNFMAVASHNNRNHRKIIVVDGAIAFTGGINLADEYFNFIERFGYWKDSVTEIKGHAVEEFVKEYLFDWDLNNKVTTDWKNYAIIPTKYDNDSFVIPFTSGPVPIHKPEIPKHVILNLINQSNHYFYMTTPYLINDREMMCALENAARRGVNVVISTPSHPDKLITFGLTRSYYRNLILAGVKVYEYKPGFLHEKLIVVDDKYALTGTLNFDYRCFIHHYENAVWIYNHPEIEKMKEDFENIISNGALQTIEMTYRKFLFRLLILVIKIFAPFF